MQEKSKKEVRKANQKTSNQIDKASIKKKMSRLKDLYIAEAIDLDEYKRDYERYSEILASADEEKDEKPDFKELKKFLRKDFAVIYGTLSKEEKRTLWRTIIKEIRIRDGKKIEGISFR